MTPPMDTAQLPPRPGEPNDPELRERYLRDAQATTEARRAEAARVAAEPRPSRTPTGLIRVLAGLAAVTLIIVVGAAFAGPMLRQSETTSESLGANLSRVVLDNEVGGVTVRAARAGERPRVTTTREWGLGEPTASVEVDGDVARLSGRCPTGPVSVCGVDWVIVVPAGTRLDLDQDVGEVEVSGMSGAVDVTGGVGAIRVDESRSRQMSLDLDVGEVSIAAATPPRRIDARVDAGRIVARLPDAARYRFDLRADDVRNLLDSDASSPRRVTLDVGAGAVDVEPA